MTAIGQMADFVNTLRFDELPDPTVDHLKMHLLDTIGAMFAGRRMREGAAVGKLLDKCAKQQYTGAARYSNKFALLPPIIAGCAATRRTEVDDIHLQSCTTPGSVVIPTALSLATAGYLSHPKDFLTALAVGYELIVRLGLAINGPKALYRGIWPTYFTAPSGSAAVTAKALKLTSPQIAGAISTAITLSTGIQGRNKKEALFTRWLTVGVAAQNGVIAALAAEEGFSGDNEILDTTLLKAFNLKFCPEKFTENLGKRFCIDETGLKPFFVARQGLAAIEAFREMLQAKDINPESITEICVWVPKRFMSIIDHPNLPGDRLKTTSDVRYQIALAAFRPEGLLNIKQDFLSEDKRIPTLMKKISIKASGELERHYPEAWPAKVEIKTATDKYSCKMLYPKGDPRNRLSWDEVIDKFHTIARPVISKTSLEQIAELVRHIDTSSNMAKLIELLSPGKFFLTD